MIEIKIAAESDMELIRNIAEETWPNAYSAILPEGQVRYMLDKMYSVPALLEQVKNGHVFLLLQDDDKFAGFASYEINCGETGSCKLQKLYVLPQKQKNNYGRKLLDEVINQAREKDQQKLFLNVNRANKAYEFYLKTGFSVARKEDIDIGGGFFMNDYIMEFQL